MSDEDKKKRKYESNKKWQQKEFTKIVTSVFITKYAIARSNNIFG